jgi:hypothetical protein
MNCFEARQDFRSFWRKELTPQARATFLAHLSDCAKCDSAFRVFALSAPVLHSEGEPAAAEPAGLGASAPRLETTAQRVGSASRRAAHTYREPRRSPAWLSIAAAAMLFITGASAAIYSMETPTEPLSVTLSEAIHQPSQDVELVSAEYPETNSDFGQ